MLTLRSMFLRCNRICVVCHVLELICTWVVVGDWSSDVCSSDLLVLELLGAWVVVGFGVGMEAFGWSLIP